jgi:hypothetical protein
MTTEQQILDIIKSTPEEVVDTSEDYTALIMHLAVIARACIPKYELNSTQLTVLKKRCFAIMDAYPDIMQIVSDEYSKNNLFWNTHCNNVLNQLHAAGLLAETLGVAHL